MSNNTSPNDLGTPQDLVDLLFFSESNTLDVGNTEDTIQFTLPSTKEVLSSAGVVLDKVDIVGYDFTIDFFNLDEPVDLSLGTDSDSDGTFDQNSEILGSQFFVLPDSNLEAFITASDLIPNPSSPADLLKENQTLFLDIESTNSFTNLYDFDFEISPVFRGNLTGQDESYCCDGSHKDKYYYDRLDEFPLKGGTNVTTGSTIEATLVSKSFDPVLFLLNQDTGEVIDVEYNSAPRVIGVDTFQVVDLSYTVPNDTDNYVLSVESASANQQGEYFLNAEIV